MVIKASWIVLGFEHVLQTSMLFATGYKHRAALIHMHFHGVTTLTDKRLVIVQLNDNTITSNEQGT